MKSEGQSLGMAAEASLPQVDGARTLLISPGPFAGWERDRIEVTLEADMWRLPDRLASLRENWERSHSNERSDPKIAIRNCRASSNGQVRCTLAPTEWKEVRPWHEARADSTPISNGESFFSVRLPNIAVAHVVATTTDHKILLARRSLEVHYHPGAWTASYEEGLAPKDLELPRAAFHAAAERGAAEEILGRGINLVPEKSHLLAFIAETPLGNPAAVMMIEVPLAYSDLADRTPLDTEFMPDTQEPLPLDPDRIASVLCNADRISARSWHPTARYRLLALMLHRFGQDATIRALNLR
jgi:hypothetical protein